MRDERWAGHGRPAFSYQDSDADGTPVFRVEGDGSLDIPSEQIVLELTGDEKQVTVVKPYSRLEVRYEGDTKLLVNNVVSASQFIVRSALPSESRGVLTLR